MFETGSTFTGSESIFLMTSMTNEERMQRESNLIATIRKKLPDFARMCADDAEHVLLHQDAFAADYQEDEYKHRTELSNLTHCFDPCVLGAHISALSHARVKTGADS
jgi:hypothetical protein